MSISRRSTRHSAAVLTVVTAAAVTGLVTAAGSAGAAGAPAAATCQEVQDPPAQLPLGVEDGDLLFVTKYHPVLVQVTCGRLELVELTGWDSCYFLHEDTVIHYPC